MDDWYIKRLLFNCIVINMKYLVYKDEVKS